MQGLSKDCYSRFPCGLGRVVSRFFFVNLKVLPHGNLSGKSLQVYDWLTYEQNHLVMDFYLPLICGSSQFYFSGYNIKTHYWACLRDFYTMLIATSLFLSNIYLKYSKTRGEDPLHKCKTSGSKRIFYSCCSSPSFQPNMCKVILLAAIQI